MSASTEIHDQPWPLQERGESYEARKDQGTRETSSNPSTDRLLPMNPPSQQEGLVILQESKLLDPEPVATIIIPATAEGQTRYDESMEIVGRMADACSDEDAFAEYQGEQRPNTLASHWDTLTHFSAYLAEASIYRSTEALFHDAEAWRGMSYGLLKGYRTILVKQGYATGTISHHISVVRTYCSLAHQAGVLSEEQLDAILAVKGYRGKKARNVDASRVQKGVSIRKGAKKAEPTRVRTYQALRMKRTTTQPARQRRINQDAQIAERDALLMGLLIEHALRISEVVSLNIEQFDLQGRTFRVYREKTNDWQTHELKAHTLQSAEVYLQEIGRDQGPLFVGYRGRRMQRAGLAKRVRLIGEAVGIQGLSPHDLRHFWTEDALANHTPIDRVQSAGNWTSAAMVLRYAKRVGIANEGVVISEENLQMREQGME